MAFVQSSALLKDLISLVYPRVCVACDSLLYKHEQFLCSHCAVHLPLSNFHLESANPVERLFYGRVPLHRVASMYLFTKGGKVQKILHEIKYEGNRELALMLGQEYGRQLLTGGFIQEDVLVPVPLHPKKQRQRGFNQSEAFARGIAETASCVLLPDALKRTEFTSTQTRQKKYDRWKNVHDRFALADHGISGKNVLLIDDVITTGATIEACCTELIKAKPKRISVVSLAFAPLN